MSEGFVASERPASERYALGGELGRSAVAVVYRVEDRELGRIVTLRTLPEALAADPKARHAFVAQVRRLATLQHPGIPPIHDVGTFADGTPFATMSEIEGNTLEEAIEALHEGHQGISLHRLIEVIRQVAWALAHAHGQDVVHGDIDPDSVLLGEDGEVVLVDWGSADAPTGPLAYRAPEQATARRRRRGRPPQAFGRAHGGCVWPWRAALRCAHRRASLRRLRGRGSERVVGGATA